MSNDYNKVLTAGIPNGLNAEGEACPDCGQQAEFRECHECGANGWVIDCGHYAQPRPLACGNKDGVGADMLCEDCA